MDIVFSPIDFTWDGHKQDVSGLELGPVLQGEGQWDAWISHNSSVVCLDPLNYHTVTLPFTRDSCASDLSLLIPEPYRQTVDLHDQVLSNLRDFINKQTHLYPEVLKDIETSVCEWIKKDGLIEEYIKLSLELP